MAIGNSNISMFDVAAELQSNTTNIVMNDLFATSGFISVADAGNYHNFGNMSISNSLSFATTILYTAGSNLKLSNWAYYDHNIEWVITFELINNGTADVDVVLWFGQGNGNFTHNFYTTTVPNGGSDNRIDYNTTIASYITGYQSYGGAYFVLMEAISSDVTKTQFMNVTTATDTDGVGGGTTRTTYTSVAGTWDFNNGNFASWIVAGDNDSTGISWNKRTSFQVVFS